MTAPDPTLAKLRHQRCNLPKDAPDGYLAWHYWAETKNKTHRAVRCREHGLYHNWVPRKKRRSRLAGAA